MAPVHPGEVLLEEFLGPLGVSQYQLAKAVDVPARGINEIVHGQRRISADTALRLARYFGTSERFWMNLQAAATLRSRRTGLVRHSMTYSPERRELTHPQALSLASTPTRTTGPCRLMARLAESSTRKITNLRRKAV